MIAIQYDDFDRRFLSDFIGGGYIGTVTCECGNSAWRHWWKIVEVYEI